MSGSNPAEMEIVYSVSDGDLADRVETGTVSGGDAQQLVAVDIEPLKNELVGVNDKLSVILTVVVILLVWKCLTVMYKFFDMFF